MISNAKLSPAMLGLLEPLVGETYEYLATGWPRLWTLQAAVIATDQRMVELSVEYDAAQLIDDEIEEVCRFLIKTPRREMVQALVEDGSVYFQKANSKIRQIYVIRETLQEFRRKQAIFTWECDVAIVLEMQNGAVCMRLDRLDSGFFEVTFLDELNFKNLEPSDAYFTSSAADVKSKSKLRALTIDEAIEMSRSK